jgi:hypothetical protein
MTEHLPRVVVAPVDSDSCPVARQALVKVLVAEVLVATERVGVCEVRVELREQERRSFQDTKK